MRRWAPKNLAVVYIARKRIYLGTWGSPESIEKYSALVLRWASLSLVAIACPPGTVAELADRYVVWAKGHYRKSGVMTTSGAKAGIVAGLLYRAGLGRVAVGAFGPLALGEFQTWLAGDVEQQWARRTINEYVRIVVDMFRWGVSKELVQPAQLEALRTVRWLAKGRPAAEGLEPAREGRKVESVDRDHLRRARRLVPAMVRAMIDLQLLTGMRPEEVCAIRPALLRATRDKGVMVYTVPDDSNKVDLYDITRMVWLGPRALKVLRWFWPENAEDYFFSPRRAEEARNAAKREARKSKRWPSHGSQARRERRAAKSATWGARYSPDSYRRAITRACVAAGIVPAWTPNQLRHSAATRLANAEQIHVARIMLGHTDIATTVRYVDAESRTAIRVARKSG